MTPGNFRSGNGAGSRCAVDMIETAFPPPFARPQQLHRPGRSDFRQLTDHPRHKPAMPDNSAKIRQLQALLDAGITRATVDGETVDFGDEERIRRRLRELKASHTSPRKKLPRYVPIDLPSAFNS